MELSRTVGAVQSFFNDFEKSFLGSADDKVLGRSSNSGTGSNARVNPAVSGVTSNAAVAIAAAIVDNEAEDDHSSHSTAEAAAAGNTNHIHGGSGAEVMARALHASFVYKFGVPALAQFKLVALFDAVRAKSHFRYTLFLPTSSTVLAHTVLRSARSFDCSFLFSLRF
jgi:hypothetical protein